MTDKVWGGWSVQAVTKKQAARFVVEKHYSRRESMFFAAWGLVDPNGWVQGVVVYAIPSAPINRHAFRDRDFKLLELSRLVVQVPQRNAASYLLARTFPSLPQPCALISYADSQWGHCGIVYQATNWLYTGATLSHDHLYLVDGQRVHPQYLRGRGITSPKQWARENGIETVAPSPKHRYFQFVGNRREVRDMKAKLAYPGVSPYPKAPATRYDDGAPVVLHIDDVNADTWGLV
jgi:hypothetical protein